MTKVSLLESQPVKLLIAVGGIYTTYIYWGLLMERLFNQDYSGLDRKKGTFEPFKFGFATSLFQNIFSFILAAFINRKYEGKSQSSLNTKTQLKLAFASFFSLFLASQALAYVSFPVQAIMKSSKIISILIVSLLFRSKVKHTTSQYMCGFLITLGIVLFNSSQDGGKHGNGGETSIVGIVILVFSLLCDGYLGLVQSEAKRECNPSAWDLMECTNKWAIGICFVTALVSNQFFGFIEYVQANPAVWGDLLLLSALGTIGQIFIYYTISNFSPLVLSIITTTRKFFTVLFSIFIYSHPVNTFQWFSIVVVFAGVFWEIGGKKGHGSGADKKKEEDAEKSMLKSQSSVQTSQTKSQVTQKR